MKKMALARASKNCLGNSTLFTADVALPMVVPNTVLVSETEKSIFLRNRNVDMKF